MSQVARHVRELVNERDRGMCVRCPGGKPFAQVHHRRPRAMGSSDRGSTNQASNLLSLCAPCHLWVESHREQALSDGFIVSQSGEPSTIPVRTPRGTFMFDDLGAKRLLAE